MAVLIAPFCPHLAEELWQLLGHNTSVCDAKWPEFNDDFLKEDSVKMMVAFNGKARFPMEFPAGSISCRSSRRLHWQEPTEREVDGRFPSG